MELFEKKGQRHSYTMQELLTTFSAGKQGKRELEGILAELVSEGRLIRLKGPAYTLPEGLKSLRGHIKVQRQGMGFVRPDSGSDEVYIHPSQLNGAWDGDVVLVALLPGRSGKSREGRVLEVLERRTRELLVELLPQSVKEDEHTKRLARAMDSRLSGYLLVDLESLPERPRQGDMLLVAVDDSASARQHKDGVIRASAVSAFGSKESLTMYERLVKAEHNIATEFPAAALAELAALPPDPDPAAVLEPDPDLEGPPRRDLREVPFVTIDGADARDFDDAICVQRNSSGFTLWVAIADVAHYVRPDSAVDREAIKRGNSCYFPASVEPMLPQTLSNGLCSLRPGVPRLAVLAEINFSDKGVPGKSDFYRALIESRERLTYDGAQDMLDAIASGGGQGGPPHTHAILPMLKEASQLAELLLKRREERGTLSFDLPEAKAEVDARGKVTALTLRTRLFTHKLIEEFMIAANEAVARHLASFGDKGLAFLYRAHPAPDVDKLTDLAKVLAQSGLEAKLPEKPGAGDLQGLLESVRGTEREFVVNRLVLRSLMQAAYTPIPEGHFGLASEAYAHFTSPIRRYADLTVHRALLHTLGYAGKIPGLATLVQIADGLNGCEQEAVAAEREIFKVCAALYLEDYIGEQFLAVISGLSAFGLFVELSNPPCEGFVRLESLPDDYYQFDQERQLLLGQRSGKRFSLGQPLNVLLVKADPLRQEVTFELSEVRAAGERTRASSKRLPADKRNGKSGKTPGSSGPDAGKSPGKGKKQRNTFAKGSVRVRSKARND